MRSQAGVGHDRSTKRMRGGIAALALICSIAPGVADTGSLAATTPLLATVEAAAQGTPRAATPDPTTFAFGMTNGPGSIPQLIAGGTRFTYRYQYLAGGVNTGNGWTTWNPNGEFASNYMKESGDNGLIPVFTFYQLLQSKPGTGSREDEKDFNNLNDKSTMRAYYAEFALLLDKARAFGKPVIVHVEPDLSGYMQQRVVDTTNSAASIPAAVSNTGFEDVNGLPNTYQGFNQALLRMRDRRAPNVLLGMHVSAWGTKVDISINTDPNLDVGAVARSGAQFLKTAGVGDTPGEISSYDYLFVDASDRDAGFHQIVNGDGGAHWWDETNSKLPNFVTFENYLRALTTAAQRKAIVWQVPIGNTIMRSMNNTWNHYQDNKVQYWLGGYPSDGRLASLARAGVIAILWGRGADGGTSFDDTARDGITNPPPINGNNRTATVADDDGGYLRERMRAYAAAPLRIDTTSADSAVPQASTATSPPTSTARPTTAVTAVAATSRRAVAAVAVATTKSSKRSITFRVTAIGGPAVVHVELDGKPVSGPLRVPAPTRSRPSTTLTVKNVVFSPGGHTVTFHVDSGQARVSNVKV